MEDSKRMKIRALIRQIHHELLYYTTHIHFFSAIPQSTLWQRWSHVILQFKGKTKEKTQFGYTTEIHPTGRNMWIEVESTTCCNLLGQ